MRMEILKFLKGSEVGMIKVADVCKELESLWCLDVNNECSDTCTEKKKQAVRDAIALLKEQAERIEKYELERSWDENPDTMGKW